MLAVIGVALVVFRELIFSGSLLMTTDDNIGELLSRKTSLPEGFFGYWSDQVLVGLPGFLNINWTNILLWLLPAKVFSNWIHAIDLGAASFFFVLFLRRKGLSWPACAFAALCGFWLGSNFTLTFAGHLGKFGLLVFAAMYLWLIELAIQRKSIRLTILAGFAMGGMFLEQVDMALFFAIPLGLYAVFQTLASHGKNVRLVLRVVLPLVLVAFLIAIKALYAGYTTRIEGITLNQESPEEQWNFITQWSWPPEESIDFIAPGFTGWRSGEPDGAYRGRMGRSAGWEETRQGFRNFKLENQYLGAVPVMICLLMLILSWRYRKDTTFPVKDVLFWGIVTLVTLLLAFGKYFPLYRIFYQLPVVSSIRNPNKFLQVFQVAFAIVAAYGLDVLLKAPRAMFASGASGKAFKRTLYGVMAVGGLMLLAAMLNGSGFDGKVQKLAQDGWGSFAENMVRTKITALVYGGIMLLVGAVIAWMLATSVDRKKNQKLSWGLVALVVIDVLFLSQHYVKTVSGDLVKGNHVTEHLEKNINYDRLALFSQDSFYNHWMTYLFPAFGFNKVNITQMPRMPDDYKAFLGSCKEIFRQWQLFGVRYVLGPAGIFNQLQSNPRTKDMFTPEMAYNVYVDGEVFKTAPSTREQPGGHLLLRFNLPSDRYVISSSYRIASKQDFLDAVGTPTYQPYQVIYVDEEDAGELPPPSGSTAKGSTKVHLYEPGYVKLQVSCNEPGILRVAEKYDAGWKVTVNGEPAKKLRCDFLFMGVHVDSGIHTVVWEYDPENPVGALQLAGAGLALVSLLSLLKRKKTLKDGEHAAD